MRHSWHTPKANLRDLGSCSPSPALVGYEERCNSSGNVSKSTRALSDYVNNKSNYALIAWNRNQARCPWGREGAGAGLLKNGAIDSLSCLQETLNKSSNCLNVCVSMGHGQEAEFPSSAWRKRQASTFVETSAFQRNAGTDCWRFGMIIKSLMEWSHFCNQTATCGAFQSNIAACRTTWLTSDFQFEFLQQKRTRAAFTAVIHVIQTLLV